MKQKVKILFGLEATGGGALKHLIYLISHLDRDIFDITFIHSHPLRSIDGNTEIEKLKFLNITVIPTPMSRHISLFKDASCLFQTMRFLRRNQFDIVHAHSSKAGFYFRIASWLNNVPVIAYTPHCFYFQAKTGMKRFFFEFIERSLGYITDAIIVSENESKQGIKSKIGSYNKFVNINNAINFNDYVEYEREVNLKRIGLCESAIVVGAIGRLVEQKDLLTLVLAAKKLVKDTPNLYFVIAGQGEQSDLLKIEIERLGLVNRVLLLGHQFNIGPIFSVIDIFVNTSLWEGLPYVILEAMFYKKPIVATDVGYQNVLIDEESGYLVPARDVASLCEKLTLLINDKELRHKIGEKNRINLDLNFSFKRFVNLHEKLYINLYNSKKAD